MKTFAVQTPFLTTCDDSWLSSLVHVGPGRWHQACVYAQWPVPSLSGLPHEGSVCLPSFLHPLLQTKRQQAAKGTSFDIISFTDWKVLTNKAHHKNIPFFWVMFSQPQCVWKVFTQIFRWILPPCLVTTGGQSLYLDIKAPIASVTARTEGSLFFLLHSLETVKSEQLLYK